MRGYRHCIMLTGLGDDNIPDRPVNPGMKDHTSLATRPAKFRVIKVSPFYKQVRVIGLNFRDRHTLGLTKIKFFQALMDFRLQAGMPGQGLGSLLSAFKRAAIDRPD